MSELQRKGRVQTVLGLVEPGDLGVVLPHEQPLVDLRKLYRPPAPGYPTTGMEDLDFSSMANLAKIRQFPFSVRANLLVDSPEEVIEELNLFKKAGGGTICDISPKGVRVKPHSLPDISRATGLHIVAGTSFYVDALQSEEAKGMSVREKAEEMVRDITEGDGGMRCGVIGEVGCSWPLAPSERINLQAASLAQKQTGAPVMIHPGAHESSPFQILDILESEGCDLSRVVMGHVDRTIDEGSKVLELARRGCYVELDLFGTECSYYQLSPPGAPERDMPSDGQRINMVKVLVDGGYPHKVLISQDIHSKHRMARYGGHGYAHILEHVVPKMVARGISRDTVTDILTLNPQTWLTFV